jgi:protein-tyrosine kinase
LQAVVAERLDERRATTLGVTSPRNCAGKTLTAVNLAISLAKDARRKVLLVDLDLRQPSVHKMFGFDARTGVEDCLFEGMAPSEPLFCPSVEGLAVLPARGGSRNVAQVLSSANLAKMLEELKRLAPSSIVIFDLPSIDERSDASAFEQIADALLVVVEDGVTTEREFRHVAGAISTAKLLGTVLNRAEASA